MITLLLLLQPKPTTSDEEMMAALRYVEQLQDHLEEQIAARIIRNESASHQEYTYAIAFGGAAQALTAVQAHQDYQALQCYLQPLCTSLIAFCGDLDIQYRRRQRHLQERYSTEEWARIPATERVKVLLMDQLDVPAASLVPQASLVEDLNADSLDLVEIIMGIEAEFHVKIAVEEAEKLVTVGDILAFLKQKDVH